MQSVSTGIAKYLAALDPNASKALRAARNNRKFAAAVERVWEDNPLAGDFVLAHVNSLYFAKDDAPRKGQNKDVDRYIMGVYVDDATARAELNARRETLALALMQDGFRFDEIRIIASKLGMRDRRAFPDKLERIKQVLAGDPSHPDAAETLDQKAGASVSSRSRGNRLLERDESKLLETFKRAVCLAFGDLDQAAAFLSRIEGAALIERYGVERRRQHQTWYACRLYASAPVHLDEILQAFAPSIISHAKELGLNLVGIDVLQSPPELVGNRAFPAAGTPRPYRAEKTES